MALQVQDTLAHPRLDLVRRAVRIWGPEETIRIFFDEGKISESKLEQAEQLRQQALVAGAPGGALLPRPVARTPSDVSIDCPVCGERFSVEQTVALGCKAAHSLCYGCAFRSCHVNVDDGAPCRCPLCPGNAAYVLTPQEVKDIIEGKHSFFISFSILRSMSLDKRMK